MVDRPPDPLQLIIGRRFDAQARLGEDPGVADGDSIDAVRLGALNEKHVRLLAALAADVGALRVRSAAARADPHRAVPEASGLALHAQEPVAEIEHEVVALVGAQWPENPVAETRQCGDDDGLGSVPDIDGMRARPVRWRRQR